MAELGVGYISIIPDASKVTPGIKKALGDAEPEYGKAGDKGGKTLGSRLMGAAGKTMKAGGVAAGAAAGGAITVGITKGIGRLNAIEQAESKLSGLGNSGQKVGSIMEDALASVKGTAYGLGDAATVAASAVAAGVQPGEDLERTLKLVGDAAAIAGTDLSEMGSIFNKVATSGKVQGDVLNQLSDQGIPIVQLLADEIGVTAEEVYKLGRDGEINFEIFRNAIEKGMGGAALEAGNTTQGALANVGAAAGRLGATLAGPFFTQAQGAFVGVTDAIDEMNDRAAPAMDEFSDWMTGVGIPAVKDFAGQAVESFQDLAANPALQSAFRSTQIAIGNVVDAGKALAPVMLDVGQTVAQAASAVGVSTWDLFATGLGAAATVAESLAGPLQTVADFMSDHPALVTAGIAAWAGFKTVPRMLTGVATGIAGVTGASKALDGVSNPIRKIGTALSPIRDKAVLVGSSVREAGVQVKTFASHQPGVSKMSAAMQALGNNVPAVQRMTQAYAASSAGLKSYAAQQQVAGRMASTAALQSKDLFTTVDRMGASAFRNATGAVSSFAGTVKGVGAAGLTGMKTAAKGVMDLMGGPWGAALAVGAGAVMMVADWQAKWNTYLEESENLSRTSSRAYSSMFDAIVDGASKLDTTTSQVEDLRENLTKVGQSDPGGISRWFKEIQLNVEEAGNAIRTEAAKTSTAQERAWLDSADAAEKAVGAMDRLGLSNEEIARQVGGSLEQFAKFKQELKESGEGGEELAAHMQTLRDANNRAAESAERLGPAASNAAQVISDLGTKSATSADDVKRLHDAIYGLGDGAEDAGDAAGNLTEKIDQAAQAAYDFGAVSLDTNGRIDQTTTGGKEFADALGSITDEYQNSVAAGNDAGTEFDRIKDQLYRMGEAAGLNRSEMDELLTTMGLMPNQVQTTVNVAGDTAKSELVVIGQTLANLNEGDHTAEISVTDEQAKQALEDAGFELEKWDEETGVGTLKVDDEQAISRFTWWTENGFPEIDTANPTAEANLDTTGLGYNAHWAQMQVDTLDMSRPSPLASMNVDELNQRQIDALNKIGLLDGKKPTPRALMNMDEFDRSEQVLLAQIFDLSKKEAVPLAKLLGLTKFKGDTEAAKRYLNSIPANKNVTISYNERRAKILEDQGKDPDFIGPVLARGGRLPKNSRGSRLPTSGPGTDRTDGILGISADGTPMSWVDAGEWIINADSSEKYDALLSAVNADDPEAIAAALPENAGGGRAGALSGAANLTMGMDLEGILAEQAQENTFDPLMQSWQSMAQGMQDADSSLVAPTLANVQAGVAATGEAFTSTVQGIMNPQVSAMGGHLQAVQSGIVDPTLAAVRSGLDLTGQWMTNTVQGTLNPQWSGMGNHLAAVKDGSVLPTFGGIQTGIDTLAGWFSTGVGNMSTAFDRIKPGTGGPGAFVVREVFNNGIRNAWNAISDLIDAKDMGPVPMGALGAYANGGVLPGYTPGRDVHEFSSPTGGRLMLSGGEAIMRPEWTRAVGGPRAVDEMNAAARSGNLSAAAMSEAKANDYQAFAEGGIVQAMTNIVQRKYPMLQMTSGYRPGDGGNHGAGRAGDFSNGSGNTPQQLALAKDIAKTYPNSMELIYDSPGWAGNIKDGANVGAFGQFYTMAQAGPHHHHVHWAMNTPPTLPFGGGVFPGGSSGAGAAVVSMAEVVKKMWDDEIKKIPTFKDGAGQFGQVPAKFQEKAAAKVWAHAKKLADKMDADAGPGSWNPGAGVEQYRPGVVKAFKFQDEDPKKNRVDALLRQIWTESKGDPNIAQQIVDMNGTGESAGVGLYQVIPSTWQGYRDPRLPDNRRNVWAAHNFAVRYFRDRHNWNTGPGGVGLPGTGWKDGGVLPSNLPAALFDTGGFLNSGEAAVNMSGSKEPVFTASQWAVLKQSITANAAMVDPLKKWVDGGITAIERVANGVESHSKGWSEWAAADEDRGRIGNPEELAIHFGGAAAQEFAADALSLIGIDGLADIRFSESFVDLVNAASDTADDLWDIRLGHINQDSAQPASVLDDDLRNPLTKVEPEKEETPEVEDPADKVEPLVAEESEPEPLAESEPLVEPLAEPLAAEESTPEPAGADATTVNITLEGSAYTADQVEKLLSQISAEVDSVEVRVNRLEKAQTASVVAGMIV